MQHDAPDHAAAFVPHVEIIARPKIAATALAGADEGEGCHANDRHRLGAPYGIRTRVAAVKGRCHEILPLFETTLLPFSWPFPMSVFIAGLPDMGIPL